jgi:antibiotic biosynthesis monooxygenase (ABM) superfamily enzyme
MISGGNRMSPAPATDPLLPGDLIGTRVSTVVVQRVPADRVSRFLECQRALIGAAKAFPGYQSTELIPPSEERPEEWVAVIHFDDQQSLQLWLDSPVRAEWVKKLREDIGDFELKTLPSGFGIWFAGLATGPDRPPPASWKIAMTVLLWLYPVVMVLAVLTRPLIPLLGIAAVMLISNTLSVAIGQWLTMPLLTNLLRPWFGANTPDKRMLSIGVLILMWLFLGCLVVLFRFATG